MPPIPTNYSVGPWGELATPCSLAQGGRGKGRATLTGMKTEDVQVSRAPVFSTPCHPGSLTALVTLPYTVWRFCQRLGVCHLQQHLDEGA